MLSRLFPLKLHLHILQLEGYKTKRFLHWIGQNYLVRQVEEKKPLVWTPKAKQLYFLALVLLLFTAFILIAAFNLFGFVFTFFLATQSYIFLLIALVLIKPYEYLNRIRVRYLIKQKIKKLKKEGLIVIGITGSYGKTTTKEFLYHILKTQFKVLKPPESYNTLFGIYKVVDLALTEEYEIFICEMGAYHQGEIKELCDVVLPDHGILTGINEQHFERFGSLANTIRAKFELIQALPFDGIQLLNADNKNTQENYQTYTKNALFYGETAKENRYENLHYSNGKTNVTFFIDNTKCDLQNLNIMGRGNIVNALGASVMAAKLGVSHENIIFALKSLKPAAHRLEIKDFADRTIIDDAYSSNVEGFKVALEVLASFSYRPKVLATPGIVELGEKTEEIHQELGDLASKVCDYVVLVVKSDRTNALASQIDKEKLLFIDSINDLNTLLAKLSLLKPVILLENDLPDNY